MRDTDAYVIACEIADRLLALGYPVLNYEVDGGTIVIRLASPRGAIRAIYADPETANSDGFIEAIEGGFQ